MFKFLCAGLPETGNPMSPGNFMLSAMSIWELWSSQGPTQVRVKVTKKQTFKDNSLHSNPCSLMPAKSRQPCLANMCWEGRRELLNLLHTMQGELKHLEGP